MGAKASTSADAPPEPSTPSGEHLAGSRESSGLAAILADFGRRASLDTESNGRRAGSFSGIFTGGSINGATSGPFDTPSQQDSSSTSLSEGHSLPLHFMSFNGIRCPVCSKVVLPHDCELHIVMCLTKPSLAYNEELLIEDRAAEAECVICLEEFTAGQTIARLPCLCIYHKSCIDAWFSVNRSCPEHPSD